MIRELTAAGILAALAWTPATAETVERDDLASLFEAAGTRGTMVVHDHASDTLTVVDAERAGEPFTPASTFKIPNFLIAVETGLAEPDEIFEFDAAENERLGRGFVPPGCDQDVTLAQAFARSCVPVYQEVAERIGVEGYADWLQRLGYGEGRVDETNLTDFWLEAGITIDAEGEVDFLDKLTRGETPFSDATVEALREAARLEKSDGAALFAKTGWGTNTEPGIGWIVGWVERGEDVTTFALNLDMVSVDQAPIRREIAETVLSELGYWPQG